MTRHFLGRYSVVDGLDAATLKLDEVVPHCPENFGRVRLPLGDLGDDPQREAAGGSGTTSSGYGNFLSVRFWSFSLGPVGVTEVQPLPQHLYGAAVALWQQTGLTRPWNDPDADLRRAMAGTASTVLAAVDREALLGTAMVGHDGHRAWVYYLAVTPTKQGSGLGRRLMRACEEWARTWGVPKLQLMVRADNCAAVAFYQRLGYLDAQVTVLGRRLDQGVP